MYRSSRSEYSAVALEAPPPKHECSIHSVFSILVAIGACITGSLEVFFEYGRMFPLGCVIIDSMPLSSYALDVFVFSKLSSCLL